MQELPGLSAVVDALCNGSSGVSRSARRTTCAQPLPSRNTVIEITEALRSVIFPGYFGESELSDETKRFYIGSTLDTIKRSLEDQVRRGLCFTCADQIPVTECEGRARSITNQFMARLPEVQKLVAGDVEAAYQGDPALSTPDEAVFCYPGVLAITNQRLAHLLHQLKVPLLPRMITEHAHSLTGIDIHPGAAIGERLFIDHGTGIVIGETSTIGNGVRIYQGVTLGAKSFPLDENGQPIKSIPRHPMVEDDVIIYSGATILGRVTIGKGSTIGGNVWLTRSVPANSKITQAQSKQEVFSSGAGI